MLEFERLATVRALEPSEHLILLVADHVALQSVNIGKHFPTDSTILRKNVILTFLFYTSFFWNKNIYSFLKAFRSLGAALSSVS